MKELDFETILPSTVEEFLAEADEYALQKCSIRDRQFNFPPAYTTLCLVKKAGNCERTSCGDCPHAVADHKRMGGVAGKTYFFAGTSEETRVYGCYRSQYADRFGYVGVFFQHENENGIVEMGVYTLDPFRFFEDSESGLGRRENE
ncbi:hypothetical protein DRH14_01585 [Candidatus Shapirobacteria bacterium]|nr:MAG: hypothetical protein DRH14_01585 [Candidatus Shapirobacteria bacterium]